MTAAAVALAMLAAPSVAAILVYTQRRSRTRLQLVSALAFVCIVVFVLMRELDVAFTNQFANRSVPAVALTAFFLLLFASLTIPELGCFPILVLGAVGAAYLFLIATFVLMPGDMDDSETTKHLEANLVCVRARWIAAFNHTGTLVELYETFAPFGLLERRVASISQDDGDDTPEATCEAVLDFYRHRQAERRKA